MTVHIRVERTDIFGEVRKVLPLQITFDVGLFHAVRHLSLSTPHAQCAWIVILEMSSESVLVLLG
jgi:hypothetical protein